MSEKDPNTYTLINLIWIVCLGICGGAIRFFRSQSIDSEYPIQWGSRKLWLTFLIEMMTSGFVTVVTFYLCQAAGLSIFWAVGIGGIAGHEGARVINLVIRIIEKRGFRL